MSARKSQVPFGMLQQPPKPFDGFSSSSECDERQSKLQETDGKSPPPEVSDQQIETLWRIAPQSVRAAFGRLDAPI